MAYNDAVMTLSPVAYFRMGEVGGSFIDETGNTSAVPSGSPAPTRGVTGLLVGDSDLACRFSSPDDGRMLIADSVHTDDLFNGGGTFSCLFNADIGVMGDGAASGRIASTEESNSGYNRGWSIITRSSGYLSFIIRGTDASVSMWETDTPVSEGTTHHLVITFDRSNTSNDPIIYIDGSSASISKLMTATTPYGDDTGQNITIGDNESVNRPFSGVIDEVVFFGSTLTPAQVSTLYVASLGIVIVPTPPVQMFTTIGTTTYKFWNTRETLLATLPTDQVAGYNFSSDVTTATVGPNLIKKGIDAVVIGSTGGLSGNYATMEDSTSQATSLVIDGSSLDITGNISFSCWLYVPSTYDNNLSGPFFAQRVDPALSLAFRELSYETDGKIKLKVQDSVAGQNVLTSTNPITQDTWVHVAYVSDGLTQKLFINNVKQEVVLPNGSPTYDDWASIFGKYDQTTDTTSGAFQARMDKVKLFNRILSEKEVEALSTEVTP